MNLNRLRRNLARQVTIAYALLSGVWILVSDRILESLIEYPEQFAYLSILKGWLFVVVTGGILYGLLRQSERSLRESHNLLKEIIEGTTDAIFVKDSRGRYVLVNSSAAQILGRSARAIVGQNDFDFFAPEVAAQFQSIDRSVVEVGVSRSLEERVPGGGETRIFWSNKYPWRDLRGRIRGHIGIARDITEKKQYEEEREILIREIQQKNKELDALNKVTANAISSLELNRLLDVLLDRIVDVIDADAGLIFLNQNNRLEVGSKRGILQTDETYQMAIANQVAITTGATTQLLNFKGVNGDRSPLEYRVLGIPLKRSNQLAGVLHVEWHDAHTCTESEMHLLEITAERCAVAILNAQLFERTQQLTTLLQLQFERMPIGCIIHNRDGYFTNFNPAAEKIFGYSKAEVVGRHPCDLIVPESLRSDVEEILRRLAAGDMNAHSINENITKDGRTITCEWYNTPLTKPDGQAIALMSMVQDVTERMETEEQLQKYAYYDALTQLPLRQLLLERLEKLVQNAGEDPPLFAIAHLDLVRFKSIKYTLGYELAEKLLVAIADRLKSCLPPSAMLARVGVADEFVILLERVENRDAAIQFVRQLGNVFAEPFDLDTHKVFRRARIGLALSSDCPGSPEELLQAADLAIHQSGKSQNTSYAIFSPEFKVHADRQLQLDTAMRRDFEAGAFELYYQPIVCTETLKLVGLEALIRWRNGSEMVSPGEFIPLAEETGFIIPLGLWVFRQACGQFRQWRSQYPAIAPLFVSVNLSVVQLMQPGLIREIDAILKETELPPETIKLEITETAVMNNAKYVSGILEELKSRHLRLCIDDFGTGYSSLSYLHNFPFDTLKVDRSFVNRLDWDRKSVEIARTIALMAQSLDIDLVAEGIETPEQLRQLQALNYKRVQGYLFSRPVPPSVLEPYLETCDRAFSVGGS
ncbi:MAG: EAL domain-containing protein [Limnospira sp.]